MSICIFIIIINIQLKFIYTNNIIRLDDILSKDLMPSSLLMLEKPKSKSTFIKNVTQDQFQIDGSFDNAMVTMGFHRSKMNEYLCRNYLAEQIIYDMTKSRFKRRMGVSLTPPYKNQFSSKNNLITDEGSFSYKDWLSKSATLEDIYRRYNNIERKIDTIEEKENKEEEYDPNVTGYDYKPQNNLPAKVSHGGGGVGVPSFPIFSDGLSHSEVYSGPSSGHGGSHLYSNGPSHAFHDEGHIIHDTPKYHVYHESHGKDHDLSDLFEIALTALAYLAFGIFIINLIMCLTMNISTTTTTTTTANIVMAFNANPTAMETPNTGSGTHIFNDDYLYLSNYNHEEAEAITGDEKGDTLKFRWRRTRNIPNIQNPNNEMLNELAKKILMSIEAVLIANEDEGECLKRTLCNNNKYSRLIKNNNRIFIPIWSLGMSWLSGRLINSVSTTTSMLNSLKASIFGLGKANCDTFYQKCDYKKMKKKSRKKRK